MLNSKNLVNRREHLAGIGAFALAGAGLGLVGCAGKPAPDATYLLLDGSTFTSAALQGKVALVNFWATSCTSCVAEMPDIAKLHRELAPKGFETIAVAMSYDPPAYVTHFAQTRQLPFKVAVDHNGAVAKAWGDVKVTPTTFLVNKRGQVVKSFVGKPDFSALRLEVLELLAA